MPRPSHVLLHPKCMVVVWEKLFIMGTHTAVKDVETRKVELEAKRELAAKKTKGGKASGKDAKPEPPATETPKVEVGPSDELCMTVTPWKVIQKYGIYLPGSSLLNLMFVDRVCKETLLVMLSVMEVFEFQYKAIEPSLPKVELRRFHAYKPVISDSKTMNYSDDVPPYGPFIMNNNLLAFMITNDIFPKQIVLTNVSELLRLQNKAAAKKRSVFNTLIHILSMEEYGLSSSSINFGHMYITDDPASMKYNPLLNLNASVYTVLEFQSDSLIPNLKNPFRMNCQTTFLEFFYNFTWEVTRKEDPVIPVDEWVNMLLSILRSFPQLNTMLFDISISTSMYKNRARMRRLCFLMLKIIKVMSEEVMPAVFKKHPMTKLKFHMPVRVMSAVTHAEFSELYLGDVKISNFGIVDTRQQNDNNIIRCSKFDPVTLQLCPTAVSQAELDAVSSWGPTDAEPARRLEGIWFYFTVTQHPRAQMITPD